MKNIVDSKTGVMLLKRKLKEINSYKGQGTQLITLCLPKNADRSSVTKQLSDEISQSSNIKSSQTRKNVQSALRRIINYLKQIDFKLPETGLVLFSGNVSTNPAKTDVILLELIPPKPLTTKLYWCDSTFHTTPLEEMCVTDEVYGLIAIDKREATIALLQGKSYNIVAHETSGVPGKTRAGGQCLKDALIQLSNGNIISIDDIKNKDKIKSADFDNYSLRQSYVVDKWNVNKNKIYKIITKNPSLEIESSKDHLFYVFTNSGIKEKCAEELSIKDYLIMPRKIIVKSKTFYLNSNKYDVVFTINKKGRNILKNKMLEKKISRKYLAKTLLIKQTELSQIILNKIKISNDLLHNICTFLNIDKKDFIENYTNKFISKNIYLPNRLNKDFSQFLGYYLANGSVEKNKIVLEEKNKNLLLFYSKKYNELFKVTSNNKIKKIKKKYKVLFKNDSLIRLIKSEFTETNKTSKKIIPKKILMSSNVVVAGFLKGLFDAKSSVSLLKKSINIKINNKKTSQQIQLLLLRFSILSSINSDSKKKKSVNKNFKLSISEKESLKLFKKYISFTSHNLIKDLEKVIKTKKDREEYRNIIISGKEIKNIIINSKYDVVLPFSVNDFLNNKRMISKQEFKNSILNKILDKNLLKHLRKIYNYNIIPVEVSDIKIKNKVSKMVDISVDNKNFIANGLIVHNSAHRFERLRDKAAESFYKRVGEKVNLSYLSLEKLKGLIIGGPGNTKNDFIKRGDIDRRIKDKIIGTVDICYTDESGIKEILDKGTPILKNVGIVKERELVNKFVGEVAKDSLGTYGFKNIVSAIDAGKISILLISEDLDFDIRKYKCNSCNKIIPKLLKNRISLNKDEPLICPYCGSKLELVEDVDLLDYFLELSKKTGVKVELISTETLEGKQFLETFGGLGALLRYK